MLSLDAFDVALVFFDSESKAVLLVTTAGSISSSSSKSAGFIVDLTCASAGKKDALNNTCGRSSLGHLWGHSGY